LSAARALFATGLALLAHDASMAQIYTSVERADSAVVLANFRSDETPLLLIAEPPGPPQAAPGQDLPGKASVAAPPRLLKRPVAPPELRRVIDEVAGQVHIAAELLHAVIAAESGYDSRAVSPRGAIGLMQLLPATALRFGARDPTIARQNVLAGASYLKWLMALFHDDLELVLAAYNAGEQAVLKAGGRIPPYPETQAYVPRVLGYLRCAGDSACKRG
jgi:soluble lytic murein transglycosylase-like protein